MKHLIGILCVCLLPGLVWAQTEGEDPVFSGPQPGEKLAPLSVKGVYGEQAGKTWDVLKTHEGKPQLLIFMHKRTRPAFGLTRTLMTYVKNRKDDELKGGVIWLTADATETETWLNTVKRYFPETSRMPVVFSPDGIEGPGAYGLNRNVTMTVLVGNKGKVTANFALVQPSLQADLPKVLKAVIAEAGGEMPKLSELAPNMMRNRPNTDRPANRDEKLTSLLRPFIQKNATDKEVEEMAKTIEAYIKENPAAKTQLTEIVDRIQAAGKLSNYGTEKAQSYLRGWGSKKKKD